MVASNGKSCDAEHAFDMFVAFASNGRSQMYQRKDLVVLASFLLVSVTIAAKKNPPPPPPPPPSASPAKERESRQALVITEIMYDPQSGETDDAQTEWVELLNRGAQPANLKGLQITSGVRGKIHEPKQRFVLGDVTIAPNEHAVIGIGAASCYAALKLPPFAAYCGEAKYAWLTNTGDSIAIRDDHGHIIDEVVYETESPWPAANRAGGSIQFIAPTGEDPTKANDDPKNWVASNGNNSDEFKGHGRGTPGAPPKSADAAATTQPIVARQKEGPK
jgi:hypothetical protein